MPSLSTVVFCLAVFTSSAAAVDATLPKRPTHRTRSLPNGFTIHTYHPESKFEVYERTIELPLAKRAGKTAYTDAGMDWMKFQYGKEATLQSNFKWTTSSHVYAKQHINNIPVANTLAAVVMDPSGNVVSSSSSFVKVDDSIPSATPKISASDAVRGASKALNAKAIGKDPVLRYFAVAAGKVSLTHAVRMLVEATREVIDAYVDANSGEVVGVVGYTAHASMRVVPFGKTDVTKGRELVVDPEDKLGSPDGWTMIGGDDSNATVGNNVWAFKANVSEVVDALFALDVQEAFFPKIEAGWTNETSQGEFDYKFDAAASPRTAGNLAAASTNVWHVANRAHDVLYRYGFTEQCFNFQFSGDDSVGKNADPVWISVQDGSGTDNAFFQTFEDGTPGVLTMLIWTGFQNPTERDSAFDNSVILHEYAHGLSNRLTGGGAAQCLQTTESGGLGEGWSDAFADWVFQSSEGGRPIKDFTISEYLVPGGQGRGLRTFPYSTNRTVNPQTYQDLVGLDEEHAIGEVWAQALHIVHNVLVNALGSADTPSDVFLKPEKENGHSAFMHLMIAALAMQPCNPTVVQARLAWIQADQMLYNGKNTCNLWLAFAYTGLGVGAQDFKNSFSVPATCPLELKFFAQPPPDLQ